MAQGTESRRRKFWGWGYEGEGLTEPETAMVRAVVAERAKVDELPTAPPPEVGEIDLPRPRINPPASLERLCTVEPYERLLHAYGRSFPDYVRIFQRHFPHPPDVVAYPESEGDIVALLDWADGSGMAVVPFGGGTSVVGGVEPDVGDGYRATLSLDLRRLDRVLEIDRESRAARIQAGALGPRFEAQLKPHGYTLRHFPQSFEMATLGGMIATRAGGHFATLYTHIDDFVESLRCVTPRGVLETRRLPGSGAGPSPDRMLIGSEGILGILTEAWMRLQDRPTHRATVGVSFDDFHRGAQAVRALSQSGLFPTNCRLIDAAEARSTGAGDGTAALLVLGFESADHPVGPWMERALELVSDHGGRYDRETKSSDAHRDGAAGSWRDAFLRAPYLREVLTPMGVIADTFETAVTWDRFEELHRGVTARLTEVMQEVTGHPGSTITCRLTHVYPDGPAPYFTFQALGTFDGALDQWRRIKLAANEIVVDLGGTITHHHAVGRDHRPGGYDRQRPELFARALAAAKRELDPSGLLNPGVLIDPPGRTHTGGALGTAGSADG